MTPWAPKKPCAEPRCSALVPAGQSRCPEHAAAKKRRYEEARPPELVAFYNSTRWKRFRAHEKAARVVCECADAKCKHRRWAAVCTQPSSVIDHIIEPMRDWSRALDPTNVQAMCASCHSSKTARTQSWHRS